MIELYGHPFSAFVWKVLIALYERDVPFVLRMVDPDHPDNAARIAELAPTGQFPVLVEGDRTVIESNIIIEYLDRHGERTAMVPSDPDAAIEARMLADVVDDYIAGPVQRIIGDSLRTPDTRDSTGVVAAQSTLDRTYGWLDRHLGERTWGAGDRFGLADCAAAPALFYADWTYPIPAAHARLRAYRARLLARPSVARAVDEARPYRAFFPLGAPDRD